MGHFDVGDYRLSATFRSDAFCAIFKLFSTQNQMHGDQTARQKIANRKTICVQTSHASCLHRAPESFARRVLFNTCLARWFCKWTKKMKEILFLIGVCTRAVLSVELGCAVSSAANMQLFLISITHFVFRWLSRFYTFVFIQRLFDIVWKWKFDRYFAH